MSSVGRVDTTETAVVAVAATGNATALAGVPVFGVLLRAAVGVAFPGRQYGGGGRVDLAVTLARAVSATGVGVKAFTTAATGADRQRAFGMTLGTPPPPSVLQAMLADKTVRAAGRRGHSGAALVRALAQARLRAGGEAGPAFTLAMPATSLPVAVRDHPGVTRFFQFTHVTTQVTGFTGQLAARKAAADFARGLEVARGWSAIATSGRRGRDAYVKWRKTRTLHGTAVKAASAGQAEEASLRRLLVALPTRRRGSRSIHRSRGLRRRPGQMGVRPGQAGVRPRSLRCQKTVQTERHR